MVRHEERLWTIKIAGNKAYFYKAGKQLDGLKNPLVGAKTKSLNVRSQTRITVELEFASGGQADSLQFATVDPKYFNKFGSDGDFRSIITRDATQLSEEICAILKKVCVPEKDNVSQSPSSSGQSTPPQSSSSSPPKRALSPIYSKSQETSKKKKKRSCEPSTSEYVKDIETRCSACRLEGAHFIPIQKFDVPPKERQIRRVDDSFLALLEKSLKDQPDGNYEPLFVLVKNCEKKESFDINKIEEYEYEVLGGTHLTLATKKLHEQYPGNKSYFGRFARIYVGLKDEEARWLGAMHNNTGAIRHGLTYIDELEICRQQQKQTPGENENWRDMCSSLLNKPKRNISEIFTMAQISQVAWNLLLDISSKYEKGDLKDQKVKAVEIIKGKPVLKQWQFKELCSLSDEDRTFLLDKVSKLEMNLDEMKLAAKEIKQVRPIQVAIVDFFKFKSWEEASNKFGEAVSIKKLLRYAGKAFEGTHEFQMFLKQLKRITQNEDQEPSVELLDGHLGSKGMVIYVNLEEFQTEAASKLLSNFEGSFLGIGDCRGKKEVWYM
ncbi:uncharacterized protein LOC110239880 [Exaiptasia diaphana]|uniref:Uncharacterized protein n=1 Tax=Exaiptasia diaphana TaxID=2652724 RepID=A0A913X9T6_EXADI|nr:uncharacterized protein LOC110239880 [Exaiptasia diaphana]